MDRNHLVGHRGCPLEFPENSLPGIQRCLDLDALHVEIDVQVTRDHRAILHHDRTLDRLCGRPGAVHQFTLDELGRLSFSEPDFFGSRFEGLPPARLDEVVRLCRTAPGLTLFIEVKPVSVEQFGIKTVLGAIRAAIGTPGPDEVLICYRPDLLEEAGPWGWSRTGLILHDWEQAGSPEAAGHRYLFCSVRKLPETGRFHRRNQKLGVYDVISPDLGAALLRRGVDLVETFDLPGMLGPPS